MNSIDAEALTDVIQTHGPALVLYARQWCQTPDDALQEALIELVRQDPVPRDVVAWLHVTVRRRAMNLGRADGRRENHHRQAGLQRASWFLPQDDDLDDPIDYQAYLARLPSLEREIVVSRIWGGLTFADIADLVGHPVSTIHRRYRKALSELQGMMNERKTTGESDESRPSLI